MKNMAAILASLLLAPAAIGQLVLPPTAATTEGYATDGEAWTYRTLRASCRYPASWLGGPKIVNQVSWRGDSTYAWTYDRLPGALTVRVGMWNGNPTNTWNSTLTTAFQGQIAPPQLAITQAWTPQPFTFAVPLTTPVAVVQGGLELDASFVGPWDPVWGGRATYWVDSAMGQSPTLSDRWLDPIPPYMGCAGWISETRLDRVQGHITLEARATGLPNAPALIAIGAAVQEAGCADIPGQIFLATNVDAGGWIQLHIPQPAQDFLFTWQMWIYNPAVPIDQSFGSGHACGWRINAPWPCQLLYAYDANAAFPSYSLPGIAWVVEVR